MPKPLFQKAFVTPYTVYSRAKFQYQIVSQQHFILCLTL